MMRFPRSLRVIPLLGGFGLVSLIAFPTAHGQGWCCRKSTPQPAFPVGPPIPITPTAPAGGSVSSFYGNFGPMPPSTGTFFPPGIPQTTAAFMPTAAFDTQWVPTPVTYYRPVTQFDPNYGTTVTSLQACTSTQYQAARVPMVAPAGIGGSNVGPNPWPAVNAPGYFPTGLAPAASTYSSLQQVPGAGMPMTSNMPYYANAGGSTGPSSTLPLATMSSPASGVAPAAYMNSPAPQYGTPQYGTPQYGTPQYGTPQYGTPQYGTPQYGTPSAVTNAAAWMPANNVPITSAVPGTGTPLYSVPSTANWQACPNGACPPGMVAPGSPVTAGSPSYGGIPNIPGAASVTPMGPPTYSAVAPTSNGTSAPVVPNVPNPGDLNPVLPPAGSYADPEAMRQPSLGSSASMTPSNGASATQLFPLKRVPVAEFNRSGSANTPSDSSAARVSVPQVLPPTAVQPLQAPRDFDAKPRWNPKLMPVPSDRTPGETVASTASASCITV